jgi:gamma-glutamylcyclotransferase (GGCT)/AIG2-like uncharacterized protein YtfP
MEARARPLGSGDMMLDRIFVYGTLRPSGHAFHLVQPFVVRHCPAVLTGYILVGEGHRYPWCVKSPHGEVAGELLWLRDPERAFGVLDQYEGIHDPEPEYVRVVADVLIGNEIIPAWVYVGGPAVPGDAVVVEGGDWYA